MINKCEYVGLQNLPTLPTLLHNRKILLFKKNNFITILKIIWLKILKEQAIWLFFM